MVDHNSGSSTPLDTAWLRGHPLPRPAHDVDKNTRGHVLVLGGSLQVPGGIRLTGEAALRSGAGKVRIGTVASAVQSLGALFPEAGFLALPESPDGEVNADRELLEGHLARCDCVVVGPAMACGNHASRLLDSVLDGMRGKGKGSDALVIDASALMTLGRHADVLRSRSSPSVITPHIGEMAAMLECESQDIARDRLAAAREAARRFYAVVVLKGSTTLVAEPAGTHFLYSGGNAGLATGGSGDVLAGIAGGLLARGCPPLEAALWSVWLHGEAGRICAEGIGRLGFLARDLLITLPRVMQSAGEA
ncbi:NAD(P)H-hydrate dehydratase (plasmid) [Novosphingobium sp. BL-8A]|uniref:NAD(P)H-hydrate dehydratase n=1 Tax=Novosphingobium sp. BL-8A TaxID=3127639 RepID=UPI00375814ED